MKIFGILMNDLANLIVDLTYLNKIGPFSAAIYIFNWNIFPQYSSPCLSGQNWMISGSHGHLLLLELWNLRKWCQIFTKAWYISY